MTMEEAVKTGWSLLELDVPSFIKSGGIAMKFIVLHAGHAEFYFVPEPAMINSGSEKRKLAEMIRARVRETSADVVYLVSDMWYGESSSKDAKTLKSIHELGLPRAHALGLIVKREALLCKVQMRGHHHAMILRWDYDRDKDDKITMGERIEMQGEWEGSMNFFKDVEIGNA